jgi:hypothetical protein
MGNLLDPHFREDDREELTVDNVLFYLDKKI